MDATWLHQLRSSLWDVEGGAPLKVELSTLIQDAMHQYLAEGNRAGKAPENPVEVQSTLLAACSARLAEMDSLGAARRVPEVRDALERFVTILERKCPALNVVPKAMHDKPIIPGLTCSKAGTFCQRVGGGWSVPWQSGQNLNGQDLELLLSAQRCMLFMHNPGATLVEDKNKRAATRGNLDFLVDGVDVQTRLVKITRRHPYVEDPSHPLNHWLRHSQASLALGDVIIAQDHVERIEAALHADEQRLKAAFAKFDLDGSGELGISEFRHFAVYVGIGAETVNEMLHMRNSDGEYGISLAEFIEFVGRNGGMHALVEKRRRKLQASGNPFTLEQGSRIRAHFNTRFGGKSKARLDGRVIRVIDTSRDGKRVTVRYDMGRFYFTQEIPLEWIAQDIDVIEALRGIGILDDLHYYWMLVLPASEQQVVKSLTSSQCTAIDHVRTLATHNHGKALLELLSRAQAIGIREEQVWAMLTWIRDGAPIIIHIRLDDIGPYLEVDTHYRNQFETGSSSGLLDTATRMQRETDLFGGSYDNAVAFDRPKYGLLDVMNDYRGVVCAYHYGDSYLVLRNVRLRTTFASDDSGGMCGSRLAVLDQQAHTLLEYDDNELLEVARVASAPQGSEERIGDSLNLGVYKETQIHGEIDLKAHVCRLVASERHHSKDADYGEDRVRALCRKHGWDLSWIDEERARRLTEERIAANPDGFKVHWGNGEVLACTEVPEVFPGETAPPLDESLAPHSSQSWSRRLNSTHGYAAPGDIGPPLDETLNPLTPSSTQWETLRPPPPKVRQSQSQTPSSTLGSSGTVKLRPQTASSTLRSSGTLDPRRVATTSGKAPVSTDDIAMMRPVSDLSGRALKHGVGALSKAERDRLHAEWSGAYRVPLY